MGMAGGPGPSAAGRRGGQRPEGVGSSEEVVQGRGRRAPAAPPRPEASPGHSSASPTSRRILSDYGFSPSAPSPNGGVQLTPGPEEETQSDSLSEVDYYFHQCFCADLGVKPEVTFPEWPTNPDQPMAFKGWADTVQTLFTLEGWKRKLIDGLGYPREGVQSARQNKVFSYIVVKPDGHCRMGAPPSALDDPGAAAAAATAAGAAAGAVASA